MTEQKTTLAGPGSGELLALASASPASTWSFAAGLDRNPFASVNEGQRGGHKQG